MAARSQQLRKPPGALAGRINARKPLALRCNGMTSAAHRVSGLTESRCAGVGDPCAPELAIQRPRLARRLRGLRTGAPASRRAAIASCTEKQLRCVCGRRSWRGREHASFASEAKCLNEAGATGAQMRPVASTIAVAPAWSMPPQASGS